jgi:signal transduction histidine kinase/CheY-like chemotaxis protein
MNKGLKKIVKLMAILLVLCLCVVFFMFFRLTTQYRHNTAFSGSSHLTEINRQGEKNITSTLDRERDLARDIKSEVESGRLSGEKALLSYAANQKRIWGESDIYIYTREGLCLNADGVAHNNGDASEFAYETVESGETFRIVKSQAEFACAVSGGLTLRGSPVAAVSVVHDLDTLIDDMGFAPFSGQSTVYLTKQNGVRICQSQNGEKGVYNVLSIFESGTMEALSGGENSAGDAMEQGLEGAFLFKSSSAAPKYVAMTPINFLGESLYLITVVPQNVVNQTMNVFSRNMVLLSTAMILLIIAIFLGFFILYQKKSAVYAADIRSRDRLFDLLVSETKNAYMLMQTDQPRPSYVSSNMEDILGEEVYGLQKLEGGYRLTGAAAGGSRTLTEINSALSGWDGTGEFISGYLPYCINGDNRFLRLSIHPVTAGGSEFIGIVQDVTPEYRREDSLREALALANSANLAKTQFLSSMSHDIRTPLNAIINMARFLREDLDDRDKALEEVDVITQSSEHLLSLINNVLDLSRIESGKLSFVTESFNMDLVLAGTCEIVRSLCTEKEQKFTYSHSEFAHPDLIGDALRLNQILINILNNAVKFTPRRGSIDFTVTELPAIKPGSIPFRFEIRDNGIGIPPERLGSIFDPFSRGSSDIVQRTEGTGLGLAITKNFVEAMGGSITVESAMGKGSLFTVELYFSEGCAVQPAGPARDGTACTRRFDGLCALVAEDNAINMGIASTILSGWGFTVEQAENGKKAADLFKGRGSGYYSVIYMDIQMPVMNGYESASSIRSSGAADAQTIPIIAMTANAFSEDVERARAAGMNAHVAKPIDPQELREVTAELVKGKPETDEKP